MSISIREKPPLRISHSIETPSGKFYRWGDDEVNPANIPSGERWSDVMPGGFETADAVLPRKSGIAYSDLERLSRWTIYGAGGEIVWQGRLERAPRTSGSQMAVSPSAVGYQAELDDNKSAKEIFRDIDQSHWQPVSAQRRIDFDAAGSDLQDFSATPDTSSGVPTIETGLTGAWSRPSTSEAWYDAHGIPLYTVVSSWRKNTQVDDTDVAWTWAMALATDDTAGTIDASGNLRAPGPSSNQVIATAVDRRWALLQLSYASAAGGDGVGYAIDWFDVAVYGYHGLIVRGTFPNNGLLASDIVAYVVRKYCPGLAVTEGNDGSVKPSSFLISHLVPWEPTTASEIIRQASRFELPFWGVWEGPTMHWDPSRTPRKRWRARISPTQLEETGPQVDRMWNSVMVQYQDVDGSSRTVGPPGSGANTETADLNDPDPENPANKLGIIRRDLLQMGTGTVASATKVGQMFLVESKLLDTSGRATIVGHVEDDRGVIYPYHAVRSGDEFAPVDASSPGYRRIIHADKDRSSRACSIDLDSPPEGLQALLERLNVSLVRLGFS